MKCLPYTRHRAGDSTKYIALILVMTFCNKYCHAHFTDEGTVSELITLPKSFSLWMAESGSEVHTLGTTDPDSKLGGVAASPEGIQEETQAVSGQHHRQGILHLRYVFRQSSLLKCVQACTYLTPPSILQGQSTGLLILLFVRPFLEAFSQQSIICAPFLMGVKLKTRNWIHALCTLNLSRWIAFVACYSAFPGMPQTRGGRDKTCPFPLEENPGSGSAC